MSKIFQAESIIKNDYSITNIVENFDKINEIPDIIPKSSEFNTPYISNYKERSIYDSSCFIFWAPVLDNNVPGVDPYRYWINTRGILYDTYRRGILYCPLHNKGYYQYNFTTPNSNLHNHVRKIHRVLMKAFYYFPECDEYEVNHIDGVKTNNNIRNLEWATHSENTIHAINHGLKTIFGRSDLRVDLEDEDIPRLIELYNQGLTPAEIVSIFEKENKFFSESSVSNIVFGKNRKSYFNDLYHVRS